MLLRNYIIECNSNSVTVVLYFKTLYTETKKEKLSKIFLITVNEHLYIKT